MNRKQYFRHVSKGGWPFSTSAHGWPISDCTAEGLKGVLGLLKLECVKCVFLECVPWKKNLSCLWGMLRFCFVSKVCEVSQDWCVFGIVRRRLCHVCAFLRCFSWNQKLGLYFCSMPWSECFNSNVSECFVMICLTITSSCMKQHCFVCLGTQGT